MSGILPIQNDQVQRSEIPSKTQNTAHTFPQYWASTIGGLSVFGCGVSTALSLYGEDEYGVKTTLYLCASALIGTIFSGFTCQWLGSKHAIQLSAFPLFLSHLVRAYCRHVTGYLAFISLTGFAYGIIQYASLNYIMEIVEIKRRGRVAFQLYILEALGVIFGNYLKTAIDDFILLALIPVVIPLIYLIALSFVPESPVHLCMKDDLPQARSSLQWLRGADYVIDDEIDYIQSQTIPKDERNSKYFSKQTWKKLIALVIIMAANSFLWSILPAMIHNVDPSKYPYLNLLGLCIGIFLVDRIDRPKLLRVCFLIVSIQMLIIELGSYVFPKSIADSCLEVWLSSFILVVYGCIPGLMLILMWDSFPQTYIKNTAIPICLFINTILPLPFGKICIAQEIFGALMVFIVSTPILWTYLVPTPIKKTSKATHNINI